MVLQNYVSLVKDVPAVMHFTFGYKERRTVHDGTPPRPTSKQVLVMDVDELNGVAVSAKFSTMSEKLAATLWPFIEAKTIHLYRFTITQRGEGYMTEYPCIPTLISR